MDYRVTALDDCAIEPTELLVMLPDLVVLDLQCGFGECGLDLVRGLRAAPAGCCLPVIASPTMTSCARRQYAAALCALRVELLPDPFATQDLIVAAGAALERAWEARWRSEIVLTRLRTVPKRLPPF